MVWGSLVCCDVVGSVIELCVLMFCLCLWDECSYLEARGEDLIYTQVSNTYLSFPTIVELTGLCKKPRPSALCLLLMSWVQE